MPTQIGSTVLLLMSFKMTIGMFVAGSIMRPRIFISTSIHPPPPQPLHHTLAYQRVRSSARHAHIEIPSDELFIAHSIGHEIQRAILRSAPNPLPQRLVPPLHQHFLHRADRRRIAPDLDGALPLLHDRQPPRFFLFGNLIAHGERGRVWTRRVFEAEKRVVFYFVEQRQGVVEVRFGLTRQPPHHIRRTPHLPPRFLHHLIPPPVFYRPSA